MNKMTRLMSTSSVTLCICLGLSAPLLAARATATAQVAPPRSVPAPIKANSNEKLRAAAEPFEKLAEISFEAKLPAIDRTINEAAAAARGVRALLPIDAARQLDAQIAAIKSARRKQDHAGLALASIEAYRLLVSAVADSAKVPTEVSLLDYAGFRYGADLKARPIRWGDMTQAVSFARNTWATLSARAKFSPGATALEKTVDDMDRAVTQKDGALAAVSVKAELDLVDQLETFFSEH